MPEVSKAELVSILTDWGQGRCSAEQLQLWMLDHYDPDEIAVGPMELEHTQAAMNIVMNEYEIVKLHKVLPAQYQLAIDFINASANDFNRCKNAFINQAFLD